MEKNDRSGLSRVPKRWFHSNVYDKSYRIYMCVHLYACVCVCEYISFCHDVYRSRDIMFPEVFHSTLTSRTTRLNSIYYTSLLDIHYHRRIPRLFNREKGNYNIFEKLKIEYVFVCTDLLKLAKVNIFR